LSEDLNGEMKYLSDHLDKKENPKNISPDLVSGFVVTCSYLPHPKPLKPFPGARVALYAQGEDYHFG